MKDVVKKFSKAAQPILDLCAGTSGTASACMMVTKHRRFVGCENDATCYAASMASIVEAPARKIISEKLGTVRSERVQGVPEMGLEAGKRSRRSDVFLFGILHLDIPRRRPFRCTLPVFCRTGSTIELYFKLTVSFQYQGGM